MLVTSASVRIHYTAETLQRAQWLFQFMMPTSSSLVLLGLQDKGLVFRLRIVEVAHVALSDHGFYFCAEDLLQAADKVDLKFICILQDRRVEQDLVRLAETEVELVLVEQLLVCLRTLAWQNQAC